jgi:FkbM family methyltransferase
MMGLVAGVKLISSGDRIVAKVRAGETFEPESLEAWRELCAAGGMALDIGAYTGLYAIIAAQAGCKVMAFEPLPKNAQRCRQNFAANGVDVELIEAVVADRVGMGEITVNQNVVGLTSGASLIRKTGVKRAVRSLTVDSLNLPQVTAIKIDVERAEPLVLNGARKTLERLRPVLLVEVLGDDEKAAVRAAVPSYRVKREMDGRNWLMVAR